jgi:hypothetical protein
MSDLLHISPEVARQLADSLRFVLQMNLPSPRKGIAGANDELAKKLTGLLIKQMDQSGFLISKKAPTPAHSSNDMLIDDQASRAKAYRREDSTLPIMNARPSQSEGTDV